MAMPEEEKGSIGQQLKRRRQRLKLSLTDVELATKIRGKYLVALESGDLDALPNDIYSRGFVQHYASYLGLNGQELADRYVEERGGAVAAPTGAPKLERPARLVATPKLLVAAGLFLVVLIVVGYLGYQLSAIAAPPRLSLDSPADNQTASTATIKVKGHTTPGSDVAVDDVPVATDTNGGFSTTIVLQNGINAIRVSSRSKLGKLTRVTHNVLAKLPSTGSSTALVPGKTFAGVAVAIRIDKTATQITVTVDGKPVFSGIMLPGEEKLFQGANDIKLTTSNAGSTSVTITNQNVAAKLLSPLGKDGEVRTNQDFAKDTGFGDQTPAPSPSPSQTVVPRSKPF
jgi:cytoskeletal protein RodZ